LVFIIGETAETGPLKSTLLYPILRGLLVRGLGTCLLLKVGTSDFFDLTGDMAGESISRMSESLKFRICACARLDGPRVGGDDPILLLNVGTSLDFFNLMGDTARWNSLVVEHRYFFTLL
jgi:hypothetical protein